MSAPIHMRLATLDDYPVVFRGRDEIRVIEQYDHDETTSPEESITFIKDAIKKGHVWIAILGGEPAGFIWFVRSKKCPFGVDYLDQSTEYIFIDFVWVDPKFRGRRVGNYLYDFAEEYCKRNNIPEIVLDVMPMNPKSVEFHTHIGFKPVCTVFSRKVGKKEDGGQTILPSKL